ncbi:MAG: cache domain-containing protein [Desulfobulbaceae bacterium]|uniref:histidine kinase n=1 Tax=Candidatus Desulfatifera sulfidica TaxID=2841691 RepID=A0A8J6T8S2_9BACT|nr:cache domain-containing protein [Candidatus Desulfatifera sulfidica]
MAYLKEENIGKISFVGSAILIILLVVILGGMALAQKNRHYRQNLERVQNNFTSTEMNRLKSEVIAQLDRIHARNLGSQQSLKKTLKDRIDLAQAVARNLYEKNKGQKSLAEIKTLIAEALRPFRFNNGREYFFIRSLDGVSVLYPPDSRREGLNIYQSPSLGGRDVFEKMKALVQDSGEGFLTYQWPKPGEEVDKTFEKLTYVKVDDTFDWIIGVGEYLVDFEEQLQQTIISQLSSITPSLYSSEYIFVYQVHEIDGGENFSTVLVNQNHSDLIGKKLSENSRDTKGELFLGEVLQGIRDKGEAFVTYHCSKPGHDQPIAKLTYFKYYPDWGWVVAKGVFLDQLEGSIAQMQADLRRDVKRTIFALFGFLIVTSALFLGGTYILSKRLQDIFDKYKTTQRQQQEKLALFRQQINQSNDAIFVIAPQTGQYLDVNQTACDRYQYSREEFLKMTVADIAPRFPNDFNWEQFTKYLKNNQDHLLENMHRCKDTTLVPVEINWSYAQSGETEYLVAVARDISQRKEAEKNMRCSMKKLTEANADLEQFSYVMAHDLKAPIRGISNYSTFLQEDLADSLTGEQKKYLTRLKEIAVETSAMVESLLLLARIGRDEVHTDPVDLSELLRSLVNSMGLSPDVHIDLTDDWPTINSDATLLRQVFQNLIENGIKYNTAAVKRVELGCLSAEDGRIECFVRDNGIGIDEKHHKQIFKMFERLHTQGEHEGSGIGLAIVHKTIKHLGGTIRLESTAGAGSTFYISLPLHRG